MQVGPAAAAADATAMMVDNGRVHHTSLSFDASLSAAKFPSGALVRNHCRACPRSSSAALPRSTSPTLMATQPHRCYYPGCSWKVS